MSNMYIWHCMQHQSWMVVPVVLVSCFCSLLLFLALHENLESM